ncbi:hypothetical protein [Oceanivirga salmonicida]|uniref:hypothetical protein n=1 Tax=Oceanivirga salmonicida TaxID=1769291 RepID=UPI000833CCCD|nr:hypothetical protein [Oceanivirga salmonicida]
MKYSIKCILFESIVLGSSIGLTHYLLEHFNVMPKNDIFLIGIYFVVAFTVSVILRKIKESNKK